MCELTMTKIKQISLWRAEGRSEECYPIIFVNKDVEDCSCFKPNILKQVCFQAVSCDKRVEKISKPSESCEAVDQKSLCVCKSQLQLSSQSLRLLQ